MKILSRPKVEQQCGDVVKRSIETLYRANINRVGPFFSTPSLQQYVESVKMIMTVLNIAGVIKHTHVYDPREVAGSTYENEQWSVIIEFSELDKPTDRAELAKFEFYRFKLDFKFTR